MILNSPTALCTISLSYHPIYSLQSILPPWVVTLLVCFFTAYHPLSPWDLSSSGQEACLTLHYSPLLAEPQAYGIQKN